ncbi:hypothetical protein M404DRAFT_1009412 [Pisolithus tinctorius Marx 270]|uniref:Uncharacterized protein n=1 Tax=Pisolithus tinctorius Marx 270 TaxID=870435 RepID=A0A0C3NAX3_PISTI|nr:hypothetical protein M404DRAFT_1009412 [Pisolithus tinctorius Marx 270]
MIKSCKPLVLLLQIFAWMLSEDLFIEIAQQLNCINVMWLLGGYVCGAYPAFLGGYSFVLNNDMDHLSPQIV